MKQINKKIKNKIYLITFILFLFILIILISPKISITSFTILDEVKGGSSSGEGIFGSRKSSTITESVQTISGNVYTIDELVPGETILKITDPYLAIIKVILDTAKEVEDITIKIDESRKTNLEKPENKKVYRYANIESNIFESAINKIRIIFKVKKSFGESTLLRYTYKWGELPTKKINEDKDYNYYESESLGFSTFAIAAEKEPIIEKIKKFSKIFKIDELISQNEIFYWALIPLFIILILSLITGLGIYKFTKQKISPIPEIQKEIKSLKERRPIKIKEKKSIKQEKPVEIEERKQIETTVQESPIQPQPQLVQKPKLIDPQEIINNHILRFNQLLKYISLDISQNNLGLANKRYQELLSMYKFLIIKVNKENQIKLYTTTEETYEALRTAIEIDYYKRKL